MLNPDLAPVVLFIYNRPWHTRQTLEALLANELSESTRLLIYCDGPKQNATEEQLAKISDVREVVREKKWCGEVTVVESGINRGLAGSVIHGVTEVIEKYGKIIVLEDDLVTSRGFLKYMNEALNLYVAEEKVGCIHAWNYFFNTVQSDETTFFLKGGDCWGWATWKRAWRDFNPDGNALLKQIEANNLQFEFDRKGTHGFTSMLNDQINGVNDSWAIRWHASLFLKNKFCLHPVKAVVKNIGLDNSGVHCGNEMNLVQEPVDFIELKKIRVEEAGWFFKTYSDTLVKNVPASRSTWHKLKRSLKRLLRPSSLLF